MNIKNEKRADDLTAEVIVIGGGTSGLTAALTAVEKGASNVALLEKRISYGGNGLRAAGIFAADSPLHERARIKAPGDVFFKLAMSWNHWDKVDPRVIRVYIDKSGSTIQWLEEKGVEFGAESLASFRPDQIPTWHVPKGRIAGVMKILTKHCKDKGVQMFVRTNVKKIIRGKSGQIEGVLAEKGGKVIKVKAKSIIITTGGFAGNVELLKKYFPFYQDSIYNHGMPHKGNGLLMAAEVGAKTEDFATMLKEGPVVPGKEIFSNLGRLVREAITVWVNKNGLRFIDESLGINIHQSVNPMLRQPEMTSYALLDDEIRKQIETAWKNFDARLTFKKKGKELLDDLRFHAKQSKLVRMSDSWDEIAYWIGADPDVLKATVDEYNSFCDRGRDEIFAKDGQYLVPLKKPPFYAVLCKPRMLDTIGGVKINEHMEVLDNESSPIPGLYAAGVITSGWQSDSYCSEISGSAVGFSLNSGRIAGENAAKFALGN